MFSRPTSSPPDPPHHLPTHLITPDSPHHLPTHLITTRLTSSPLTFSRVSILHGIRAVSIFNSLHKLHTLSGRIDKVVAWHAESCKVARSNPGWAETAPIYTMHEALRGYCLWGWGGPTSQLDLPSVTPLFVDGCGQLQLGVPHWSNAVIIASSL